jgi:7-keto-8-aminopelargonate synthetase-like enzyme
MLDRYSDSDLAQQLAEMEQQLLCVYIVLSCRTVIFSTIFSPYRATKLEMARLMNRETCFKDILDKRDSIIGELDNRLEEIQKDSENRRR